MKKLIAPTLALVMLFTLAACGAQAPTTVPAAPAEPPVMPAEMPQPAATPTATPETLGAFRRQETDLQDYVLSNDLALYMSFGEVVRIMGEPNSVTETRRLELGPPEALQLFITIELSYDAALLTMYYYEVPQDAAQVDTAAALADGVTLRQAQFFDPAVTTARGTAVGTEVRELLAAYGLDTVSSELSAIDFALAAEANRESRETYDAYCSVTCIGEEKPFYALTFLTDGSEVASLILYDPSIYDIPARLLPIS